MFGNVCVGVLLFCSSRPLVAPLSWELGLCRGGLFSAGGGAPWAVQSVPEGCKCWGEFCQRLELLVGEMSCTRAPTPPGTPGAHQHQVLPVWAQADIFAG